MSLLNLAEAIKAKWLKFKKRLGFKEKPIDDEDGDYGDGYWRFKLFIIFVVLTAIVYCVSNYDFGSIGLFSWVGTVLTSWLSWTILGLIILLVVGIIKREKVLGKIKNSGASWSWWTLWKTLGVILVCIVLWFEVIPWVGSWGIWPKRQYFKQSTGASNPANEPSSYRGFIFGKENSMRAGVWYTFTQGDEELFQFKPITPNTTIVYHVVKCEDPTRNWKVEVWTDSNGAVSENRLNPHGIEPNDAAKRGLSRIMIDRDAVVVSY